MSINILYRDSKNEFTGPITNLNGEPIDVSDYVIRIELFQDGTTVSLSLGDGVEFVTDGTDGKITLMISMARINQFCAGSLRVRCFNDAGGDPELFSEGTVSVEGRSFDA